MSDLNINSIFYTIQGEGKNAGSAALFVRMPFCNLACPWCDTSFNTFESWTIENFIAEAEKYVSCRLAVVTGGEPSMNKHTPAVIELLKKIGYWNIAMESNGQFKRPEGVTHFTVSPKRWHNRKTDDLTSKFYFDHNNIIDEIKLVVDDDDVFEFAERLTNRSLRGMPQLYLSPEWNQREVMLPKIVEFVRKNPKWKISLQTHKILGVE